MKFFSRNKERSYADMLGEFRANVHDAIRSAQASGRSSLPRGCDRQLLGDIARSLEDFGRQTRAELARTAPPSNLVDVIRGGE